MKMRKILTVGMILLMGVTLVLATTGTTSWDGQQGSNTVCDTDHTLHWVLTTDGQANTISSAVLTLSGSQTGSFNLIQIDSSASWQVTTPGSKADLSTLTASATYDLLTGSNAHFNLVISNGCSTPPVPEASPMVLTMSGLIGLIGLVLVSRKYKKA